MNLAAALTSVWNFFPQRGRQSTSKTLSWSVLLLVGLFASRAAYATTYNVTDISDNAADTGSLRYAVNTAADGDVIDFSGVIGTITLTNGTLAINHNVTIAGPGANLLTISGNNAVAVFTISSSATIVNISGLTIANGNSSSNGGGIAQSYPGALTVSDCTFWGNTTAFGGGGIASGGTLTVTNSTFVGNTGGAAGGGIFSNTSAGAVIANSTFYGNNTPTGPGGGIFNGGTMTVSNSTVVGNTGGGGIFNNGGQTVTVSNSIVTGNADVDCDQCGTQAPNNLIGGTPDLGPLQYNGGSTETMIPLPGSPAIEAGSSSTLAIDQRGFVRPISGASDLGAVQTDYLTVTNLNDSGAGSLRDAITTANSDGSADIVFQSGLTGTITLTSTLPSIASSHVNLAGPGANLLTVSGQTPLAPPSNYEVLDISGAGAVVNLSGLTIANGNVIGTGNAAGLNNSGQLTVENSAFSSNDGDNGGAVFNDGTLVIENSTFNNNAASEGAGIANQGTLLVTNSTFYSNGAYNGTGGGGIENSGGATVVAESTFYANYAVNGAVGGGIDNVLGTVTLTNSIVSGSTGGGDCNNCGIQRLPNLIGGTPNLGALAYNGIGATVKTMLPLPGSPVIEAGDPTQLPLGMTNDERGFPRLTAGKLDLGAAQTNYTAVQFVQQPTNTGFNMDISPAVTLEVLETNSNLAGPNNTDAVDGIPLSLTFSGTGTLGGTLTQTTTGGLASFGDLKVGSTIAAGNTLATTLTVTPAGITPPLTLTATSNSFDITLQPSTVSFNPPLPASVTYGVSFLALKATAYSAGTPTGQSVSFQVDSGPATVSGNELTITGGGTVVVEVDAAANATYAASDATASIAVAQADSSLALTASANQVTPGTSVTLTATATSTTPGTTATPTGTVSFASGATQLGSAPLSGGVATLPVTTLPVGSNSITATYAGDTNFAGSSAQLAAPIIIGTPTFTIASNPSSLTIKRGQVGTTTLTLTPQYGYTGTVNFGCNGLPAYSTCNFQPSSVTFTAGGTPVTVTLTLATDVAGQARSTSVAWLEPSSPLRSLPILPAMFFWLPGTMFASDETDDLDEKKQRKTRGKSGWMLVALAALAIGAGVLGLAGCGSMSNATPKGQQTVTVTATGSGGVSQSVAVQVTIQ